MPATRHEPLHPESLGSFLAAPPPRQIPAAVRRARLPRGPLVAALLLGGGLLAISVPLIDRVFPDRLLADLQLDLADPVLGPAEILAVQPTGLRTQIGKSDQPRASIDRLEFRYVDLDGDERIGVSHGARHGCELGEQVRIEYHPEHPELARVRGTTLSKTPRIGAAIVVFPILAIVWLSGTVVRRRRAARLLRDGELTEARVERFESVRAASTTVRRDTAVLRLCGGRADGMDLNLHPRGRETALLEERARDRARVHLLVDPANPSRRPLVVDTLLSRDRVGTARDGQGRNP